MRLSLTNDTGQYYFKKIIDVCSENQPVHKICWQKAELLNFIASGTYVVLS
jgi:hypothetical protein